MCGKSYDHHAYIHVKRGKMVVIFAAAEMIELQQQDKEICIA